MLSTPTRQRSFKKTEREKWLDAIRFYKGARKKLSERPRAPYSEEEAAYKNFWTIQYVDCYINEAFCSWKAGEKSNKYIYSISYAYDRARDIGIIDWHLISWKEQFETIREVFHKIGVEATIPMPAVQLFLLFYSLFT